MVIMQKYKLFFKMLAMSILISNGFLFSFRCSANEESLRLPGEASATAGSFIIMGGRTSDDWRFVMGPTGDLDTQSLIYSAATDKGAMIFKCRRKDGVMSLDIHLEGEKVNPGNKESIKLRVGDRTDTLAVASSKDGFLEANGRAIPVILATMGDHPQWDSGSTISIADEHGHEMQLPLPTPRDSAKAASVICRGWADKASLPNITPFVGGALNGR
jgi:hypothetical protein